MDTVKKFSIAEQSGDTKILIHTLERILLKEKHPVADYAALSAAIGRDVQRDHRHLLESARKGFEQQNHVVTSTVHNTGIKLTNDYGSVLTSTLSRVNKMTKKASRRVTAAMEYDGNIPNEQMVSVNTRLSLLGPIMMMSKPSAVKRIEAKVQQATSQLPTAETLRMFEK